MTNTRGIKLTKLTEQNTAALKAAQAGGFLDLAVEVGATVAVFPGTAATAIENVEAAKAEFRRRPHNLDASRALSLNAVLRKLRKI